MILSASAGPRLSVMHCVLTAYSARRHCNETFIITQSCIDMSRPWLDKPRVPITEVLLGGPAPDTSTSCRKHLERLRHARSSAASEFHALPSENEIRAMGGSSNNLAYTDRGSGSFLAANFDPASLERLSKSHSRAYVGGELPTSSSTGHFARTSLDKAHHPSVHSRSVLRFVSLWSCWHDKVPEVSLPWPRKLNCCCIAPLLTAHQLQA